MTELRKQFTDYVTIKQSEILEARTALKYYHGDQWTKEQLDALQRARPTRDHLNRVGRKIDGLVGVLEKLRGDPKAVGRMRTTSKAQKSPRNASATRSTCRASRRRKPRRCARARAPGS